MSHVVGMRLQDDQIVRLKRYARTLGKTPGETSALLVEEHLWQTKFWRRMQEADFTDVVLFLQPVRRQTKL